MGEPEVRMWAVETAIALCSANGNNEDIEKIAERFFAFAALGSFSQSYLPADKPGALVRPFPPSNKDWMRL